MGLVSFRNTFMVFIRTINAIMKNTNFIINSVLMATITVKVMVMAAYIPVKVWTREVSHPLEDEAIDVLCTDNNYWQPTYCPACCASCPLSWCFLSHSRKATLQLYCIDVTDISKMHCLMNI
jgi:hypothetical protein